MVIKAVTEEHLSGISFKSLPLLTRLLGLRILPYRFDDFADGQVILSALIVNDVTPGKSCLIKIVGQFFLAGIKLFPSGNFVLKNLQISKSQSRIPPIAGRRGSGLIIIAGSHRNCRE